MLCGREHGLTLVTLLYMMLVRSGTVEGIRQEAMTPWSSP
jgi:hypothetical protein